jgi:hypothetical protein
MNPKYYIIRDFSKDPRKRVELLTALREIVGRRCRKNKSGASLVSDYDLVVCEDSELKEAYQKVRSAQ